MLADEVRIARSWGAQLRGWIGGREEARRRGFVLGLPGCPVVHTWFVAFPLDVVFCAADGRVLRGIAALPPLRFSPWVSGAALTWEAPAGRLAPLVSVGDVIVLVEEPF